ncbi:MAG: outer membrane beta-barrel protein [Arachidicoccus sp.]|nr:outer membrane beta-barrel protein [Arachidicoccus sp.]
MAYSGKILFGNKKYIFAIAAIFSFGALHAQVTDTLSPATITTDSLLNAAKNVNKKSSNEAVKNKYAKYDLNKRAIDHFMFQFGFLGWANATGDYTLHGFSREFNAAFMLDHAFKSNPHYSLGYGIGYSSDNAFMNGKYADIAGSSSTLSITKNGSGNSSTSFKKFKLVFSYVEIPLEIRWSNNIEDPSKGLRFAVGLKGGFLLQAHSKGKNLVSSNGQTQKGSGYIEKIYDKKYFNTTKADATFRASLGIFTLYGTYQLTPLLRSGAGPTINPYSIGIGLSLM